VNPSSPPPQPLSPRPSLPPLGSLLDEPPREAVPPAPRTPRFTARQIKLGKRLGTLGALVLFLAAGVWGIFALAPRSEPDYLSDDIESILDYTLLSDDFNKLPIERRMELLKELVERLKTLSSDDSTAMAAFAATIKREMRTQIERNIKKLVADTIDIYARDYAKTPPEEQAEFLDDAALGFTHMLEDVAGERGPLPAQDGARLAAIKDQAKKDQERFREQTGRPTSRQVARLFEFIHRDQENVSGPVQRGRNVKFMRDMTRHLRGQDIATGKPIKGPP
jgi:hypothetical protein